MDLNTIINIATFGYKEVKEYYDKKKAEREAEEARARILFCIFVVLPILLVIVVMLIWGLPKDNSKTASIQSQEYFVKQLKNPSSMTPVL